MIGRQEQLAHIIAEADAIASGRGRKNVLFVTGEAGIGKTTLLGEVSRALANMRAPDGTDTATPYLIAFAQCSTPLAGRDIGEVEALQPWAELMAQLLERSAKDVVEKKKMKFDFAKFFVDTAPAWVTMIPLLGPSVGAALEIAGATYDQYYFNRRLSRQNAAQNAANQQQVFQQYINFLGQASTLQPLVLIIDDFHWADTSSANLLFAAARELRGKPVIFLIAYRADDALSSRGGEGHPLLHIRNELERYGLATDIDVPVLTDSDIDTLLRSRYPHYHNNGEFEQWLARAGSGNALFITQFLATLEEDGYIDAVTGNISSGFEQARVPASAQAVVQERIRRLNEETREMLRYASVEGDTFTAAVLARLTEVPQLKLLQKLRLAEETYRFVHSLGRQRLYTRETTAYRFTHALMHKVLYESLGEEERELLHEAVFVILKEEWELALQERINIEGVAARLAVHAEILHQYTFAAEILIEAARASWAEFAEKEATQQLCKVFDLLQEAGRATHTDTNAIAQLHGKACMLRAQIDSFHARHAEAIRSIHQAIRDFETTGNREMTCSAMITEIEIQRTASHLDEAEQQAYTVLRISREAGLQHIESHALSELGAVLYLRASYSQALECLQTALQLIPPTEYHALWRTLNNTGLVEIALGHYDSATQHFQKSLEALRPTKNRLSEANYHNNIAIIQYQNGDIDGAVQNMRKSMEMRQSIGDAPGVATSLHNVGLMHLMREELDLAFDYFAHSLAMAQSLELLPLLARVQVNLGNAERGRHRLENALDYYSASLETARSSGNREGMAIATLNIGSVLRSLKQYDRSKQFLEEALVLAREIIHHEYEGVAVGELALLRKDTTTHQPERTALLREVVEDLRRSHALLADINYGLAAEWREALEQTEQELAEAEAAQSQ